MKAIKFAILMGLCFFLVSPQVQAKQKARLSAEYHRVKGSPGEIWINVKFKGEAGYQPATGLELKVYKELSEDSLQLLGSVETNSEGNAVFALEPGKYENDQWVKQTFVVAIEDDAQFKDTHKRIGYKEVIISAGAITEDSVHYITARLTDPFGNPLEGEKLEIVVDRLFAPLTIGRSSYKTGADGTIKVKIDDPLPGINGVLTFEVILDSRKYGIVKTVFDVPIGKTIADRSTFDKRTMWSPPSKTPWFLIIFPNLIILGIWIVIFILINNLIRIYKSNKQTDHENA